MEKDIRIEPKGSGSIAENLGRFFYDYLEEAGRILLLLTQALLWLFRTPLRWRASLKQMEEIGVHSVPVTLITATFTGMVLALQSYIGFKRFNAVDPFSGESFRVFYKLILRAAAGLVYLFMLKCRFFCMCFIFLVLCLSAWFCCQ